MLVQNANIKFVAAARLGGTDLAHTSYPGAIVAAFSNEEYTSEFEQVISDVLTTPDFSTRVTIGTPYRLGAAINALNFVIDEEGTMYSVITLIDYPEQLSLALVMDLAKQFKQKFGKRVETCAPNGLTNEARPMMKALADSYEKKMSIGAGPQDVSIGTQKLQGAVSERITGIMGDLESGNNKPLDNMAALKEADSDVAVMYSKGVVLGIVALLVFGVILAVILVAIVPAST